jgi:mevalonate kinase
MTVKKARGADLAWESKDHNGKVWFNTSISLYDFSAVKTTDKKVSEYLQKVLKNAVRLNSEFLSQWNGFKIETQLEFPLNWGLGSSSTFFDLVAQWADVDPLELYLKSENGSGYDIICAAADQPIIYQSTEEEISYFEVDFNPSFKDKLYFVHLGEKKKSSEGIADYAKNVKDKKGLVKKQTEITDAVLANKSFDGFCKLMDEHENLVASHTSFPKVKDLHFKDFKGSVKSLGAWGGDFVLVASSDDPTSYFTSKGYSTIVSYTDMVR